MSSSSVSKLFLFLVINILSFTLIYALKCKNQDGPSENEMKRVARSCIKKLSSDRDNNGSQESDEENSYGRVGFNQKDHHRYSNQGNSGGRMRFQHFSKRSTWERSGQNQNNNRYETSRDATDTHTQYQQNSGQENNNRNNNNHKGLNNNRENPYDKSCIIHCFFEELNMLNKQDFPDKHKVIYVITRDIRDNELREFYTDAIQECFRFLELEQRMNKCQYSKSLINCMAEYARANCEDWYNHTMIFNN